jgi:hypothetical protein
LYNALTSPEPKLLVLAEKIVTLALQMTFLASLMLAP